MIGWVDNIIKLDLEYEPDLVNHVLVTNGPVDLFQGMDQQVVVAATTGDEKFVYNVLVECASILRYYQQRIQEVIKSKPFPTLPFLQCF